ncbi:hypothetical protein KV102_02040 [Mumia sp. zg.B53]|uniref:hypothetical protein n=1 Tax=Mumia sp. zg.B53 TaxID=2855449 RepID=UPI001C6DD541|nr:hypothetical protein [Mumia sp. zg.B53]MBW9213611.1 hypothetical protein [Mumia sp. zg.B53]
MSTVVHQAAGAPLWRAARATVVAATALCVALLGHLSGGGSVPSGRTVVVTVAVAAALAYRLAARRWTVRTLSGFVLAVQAGVHLWCSIAGAQAGPVAPSTASPGAVPDAAMLAGHLVATVATVALLRHGDAALVSVLSLVVARPVRRLAYAAGALVVPLLPRPSRDVRWATDSSPPAVLLLGPTVSRRGPPVRV